MFLTKNIQCLILRTLYKVSISNRKRNCPKKSSPSNVILYKLLLEIQKADNERENDD